MSKEQAKLSPKDQATLFELLKKAGAQPTAGGQPVDNTVPQMEAGSFADDPDGAIEHIGGGMFPAKPAGIEKATGGDMQYGRDGEQYVNQPNNNPLLRLFGAKSKAPIDSPNFFATINKAGLTDMLPTDLIRTKDGTPFVGPETAQKTLQVAQSFGPKTRAGFYTLIGNDPDTEQPVTFNAADGAFYRGGEKVEAKELKQLLPKIQKNMSDATVLKVADTQTLINSIDNAAKGVNDAKLGLWQGTFNKTISSYTNQDPEAAAMFRQLKTVFTEITHDLYGGTLTGNELEQATDLLFGKYNSSASVHEALKVQRNKYVNRLQNTADLLKAGHVRGSGNVAPTTPGAGPAAQSKPQSTGVWRVKR